MCTLLHSAPRVSGQAMLSFATGTGQISATTGGTMQVRVLRDACCAQDDQGGQLEAMYEIASDATLGDLVHMITASTFLQFSSTHTWMAGVIDDVEFVRVFSPHEASARVPMFALPSHTRVDAAVGCAQVVFRFLAPPENAQQRVRGA
jgi:hypothetical protein